MSQKSRSNPAIEARIHAARKARHYAYALGVVALAFAVRMALTPVLHDGVPYSFFIPAVLVAAALAGLGQAVFATALGLLLGSFFIPSFSLISSEGS